MEIGVGIKENKMLLFLSLRYLKTAEKIASFKIQEMEGFSIRHL